MGKAASLMPHVKLEQQMWTSYIYSLEHVLNTSNMLRSEQYIDISEKFIETMDNINEIFVETGYCYYAGGWAGEVNSVLHKIVEKRLQQYSGQEMTKEEIDILYKKTVWNLIQDIKRPFKKMIKGDHIFKEEAQEFANFLDYARRHYVSYSMKSID